MATRFAAMAATEAAAEAGRGGRVLSFGGQPARGGAGSTETEHMRFANPTKGQKG